jgi:Flp pilus assembly protein TadD
MTYNSKEMVLGWVHRARGELDQAATVLHHATTLTPEQAVIWYHLGVVQAERKHIREAVTAFKHALTLQQEFAGSDDARRRLAELEQQL